MEREKPTASRTYSASLLTGLLALVALGLVGLPVTTIVLGLFAAAVLGISAVALFGRAADL